jgi:hypothetical protein
LVSDSGDIVPARQLAPQRILTDPRHNPSVVVLLSAISPSRHHPDTGVGNLSHPILSRMVRNNSREIATSAIWKITCRVWRTTFAPILISFSRNVVSVQCRTARGNTA